MKKLEKLTMFQISFLLECIISAIATLHLLTVLLQRRFFEVKTMRVDSRMNKYNRRNPNRRAVEKKVAEIEAHYTKRAKKLDATFAAGNDSNQFLSAYKS